MKIYFDKLYKDDRIKELCGICVPFPKGALFKQDIDTVTILDVDRKVPAQVHLTSSWEDGSVRYIYTHFLADLPGNARKEMLLTYKGDDDYELARSAAEDKAFTDRITVSRAGDEISLDNGKLRFTVRDGGKELFTTFTYNGVSFTSDRFVGPYVTIGGERLDTVFDEWKTVKEGDIFTVLQGSGRCIPKSLKLTGDGIKFEMRISVTAGKPWMDMGFRFINATDGDIKPDDIVFALKASDDADMSFESPKVISEEVDSTGCGDTKKTVESGDIVRTTGTKDLPKYEFEAGSDQAGFRTMVGSSNYRTDFAISMSGSRLENTITAETLKKQANEHFAEVFYGTFFADYTDSSENIGVCATVFQAFQNYPKAVRSDRSGLLVFLLPDQNINADKTAASPVVFTSGMAREQRFMLHFHSADEPIYELDNRSIIYQMPDEPCLDPMVFEKAGVMPEVFLPLDEQDDFVEMSLIEKADGHARCYGMLNFGDAPDPGYTEQGRGAGNLVWTNNEYDFPHAMYMMYARTGIRRFLDYANVAAWHWMDVDVCHYSSDPLRMGGQWEHTRRHTGGSEEGNGCKGEMVCSHEWVEGLLDLYHFTGDERALSTAIGIGENVLRLLETPMYQVAGESSARETGWALRTLTALFLETHDEKWTAKCQWIVSQFKAWNGRYDNWLAPYTDNTTIRVGFMISVAVGSLMRYYRAFPSDELKEMMLRAIDDLTENFMTPQGIFVYKELPSLSRNGTNTLLLEAMAIGYELTGDNKYLEFGKKTFRRSYGESHSLSGNKRIVEDAVIVGQGATKSFAQSFLPITYFYVKLAKANMLLS
ncbi:hypothetical protein D6855_02070 [Butyrivibrio sp. CB08]|uniref:hypothetical protein n=1 Tax=Butyrivibrio sp. CB08 TaxID=2364879 RepID=UPI000EA8EFCD|nr:hypothetical protein [Butyrivibrio sp. CB08]RKM62229.1 hypothetical protein D6855_02070 [Butyrivibrio sp. CB08]